MARQLTALAAKTDDPKSSWVEREDSLSRVVPRPSHMQYAMWYTYTTLTHTRAYTRTHTPTHTHMHTHAYAQRVRKKINIIFKTFFKKEFAWHLGVQ